MAATDAVAPTRHCRETLRPGVQAPEMFEIFNAIPQGSKPQPLVLSANHRSIPAGSRPKTSPRDSTGRMTVVKGLLTGMSALNHKESTVTKPPLTLLIAAPRGFCAGVDRAIQIVEQALQKFGAPVYVRHEIVHNRYVVESLRAKGAIFVKDLNEIPETEQPVIFSAHGVAKSVPEAAQKRNLFVLDATCPLVSKVHMEASRHYDQGLDIVLVGHRGHPEVIGTMGQLPVGAVHLIETAADARAYQPQDLTKIAYVTQTTLSLDDTAEIVTILKERFPTIAGPVKEDICYATTNRQHAVKAIADRVEAVIVVGSPKSSNSLRLVEVAERSGCPICVLIERATDIPWDRLMAVRSLGLTAGASAPEVIVDEVIEALRARFDVTLDVVTTAEERVVFNLPREFRQRAAP
jgi:4-hydroxy-3-methylbut-2-en-1-yl diphosphate reductase